MVSFKSVLALFVALCVALAAFAPEAEASFGLANSALGRKLKTFCGCEPVPKLVLRDVLKQWCMSLLLLHPFCMTRTGFGQPVWPVLIPPMWPAATITGAEATARRRLRNLASPRARSPRARSLRARSMATLTKLRLGAVSECGDEISCEQKGEVQGCFEAQDVRVGPARQCGGECQSLTCACGHRGLRQVIL
jgi:hypothetical protein